MWEYSASLSSRLGEAVAGIRSHADSLGAMASKEFVYHTVSEVDARIDRVRESLKQLAPDSVGKLDKKVSRTLTQALGAYQELGRQVAEQLGFFRIGWMTWKRIRPPLLAQHPAVSTSLEELRLRLDALEEELGGQALVPEDYDVEGRMGRLEAKMSEFQEKMTGTQAFQYSEWSFSDQEEVEAFLNTNGGGKAIDLSHFPDSVLVWDLAAPKPVTGKEHADESVSSSKIARTTGESGHASLFLSGRATLAVRQLLGPKLCQERRAH